MGTVLWKINGRQHDEVKLPKFMLRKFSGDPLDWKSFKEIFDWTVLGSDSISNYHGAEISVIWLVERSAIKLLILLRY